MKSIERISDSEQSHMIVKIVECAAILKICEYTDRHCWENSYSIDDFY